LVISGLKTDLTEVN